MMKSKGPQHTPGGAGLTALILETFRFNGQLLAAGDGLTADLGLTSARWQVMGAIVAGPLPVAQVARNMGLTRQAVQRLANVLAEEGLVEFAENPNHRRAKLVRLTPRGEEVLREVSRRQVAWSNQLAKGLDTGAIADAAATVKALRERLEVRKT